MKFVGDKDISTIDYAIRLVLKESGQQDMSVESIEFFINSVYESAFRAEVDKVLKGEVHRYYGRNARWHNSGEGHWLIPVPHLRYDFTPVPQLSFSLQVFLATSIKVLDGKYPSYDVLVGTIGKTDKLTLPMIFLLAILNKSTNYFAMVSKDSVSTTRSIPGINTPFTLPDEFVRRLSCTLETKSVVSWLMDFGTQGSKLAPQVAGCLLGLQFGNKSKVITLSKQAWDKDTVIAGLTRLYGEQKARTLFIRELTSLDSAMTNEDALRVILQSIGRGD